jgi:hypothetical protein
VPQTFGLYDSVRGGSHSVSLSEVQAKVQTIENLVSDLNLGIGGGMAKRNRLVVDSLRKMNFWRQEVTENVGVWIPCFGYSCAKQHVMHRLWMERLVVSRDISMAIRHLVHSQGIVYQDLVRIICLLRDDSAATHFLTHCLRRLLTYVVGVRWL